MFDPSDHPHAFPATTGGLLQGNGALLERVAVLERALEDIAGADLDESAMRRVAQEALDG